MHVPHRAPIEKWAATGPAKSSGSKGAPTWGQDWRRHAADRHVIPFGDRYMISENQNRSRFDRHIVVNCEDDMHKAVMERAQRELISASAWIRQAVRARLQTETP
jgi:hypothetical protein